MWVSGIIYGTKDRWLIKVKGSKGSAALSTDIAERLGAEPGTCPIPKDARKAVQREQVKVVSKLAGRSIRRFGFCGRVEAAGLNSVAMRRAFERNELQLSARRPVDPRASQQALTPFPKVSVWAFDFPRGSRSFVVGDQ
jgi:hypothetical protein